MATSDATPSTLIERETFAILGTSENNVNSELRNFKGAINHYTRSWNEVNGT